MPHVVTKSMAHGSKGDLAKITDELEKIGVNIVAIGGAETTHNDQEVGVVAMLLDPDEDTDGIEKALKRAGMHEVGTFPNIHIELPDRVGELKKAVDLLKQWNILTVLSMGSDGTTAHVGLGFVEGDHDKARQRLKDNGIVVREDEHHHRQPPSGA
jgi:hypothetical protein